MAHITSLAVNLLLIVAMTMQPGLAYGFQQDCSAGSTSGFTCQGCGCCKVPSATTKCSCCNEDASDEQSGCCGHDPQQEDRVSPSVDATLSSGCQCVAAPAPLDAPSPRSSRVELRDILAVSVRDCGPFTVVERPSLASSFDVVHRPLVPHFSQIAFCVWRL